jgi:hypothetical protein
MHYALVQANAVVQYGPLPQVWNDSARDWDLRPMSDTELAALGWLPVVVVARPPDTATTTYDHSVTLVAGKPTDTWTARPMTPNEAAGFESQANVTQMTTESADAVDKLIAVVNTLNTITAMTNAAINANPAAVIKDVARECKTIARQANREARMTSGTTDSTDTGPVVP